MTAGADVRLISSIVWHNPPSSDVGSATMRCLLLVVLVLACSPGATEPPEVPHSTPEGVGQGGPSAATTTAPAASQEEVSKPHAESGAPVITLFVHEQRVDCHGEVPQKCLQIREQPTEEWSYFYDTIAGFEYEESYRYELRVAVSTDDNPPADASSVSYRLVEVVSKQRVGDGPSAAER